MNLTVLSIVLASNLISVQMEKIDLSPSADDETPEARLKKQAEKTTKRALSSALLKEMREQYTDAPIEISVRMLTSKLGID